jgi:hypothetical protein
MILFQYDIKIFINCPPDLVFEFLAKENEFNLYLKQS